MAINKKWRSTIQDVRTFRGADLNSDHFLVVGKFKIKLRSKKKEANEKPLRFNILKLKNQQTRQDFQISIRNRFEALQHIEEESVEEKWVKAAKETLGCRKTNHKEWISEETWAKIEERKTIREKLLNEEDALQRREIENEYQRKDREVKRSARRDKRNYIDCLASEAEEAAKTGNSAKVYKITKKLCNKKLAGTKPVRKKNGEVITDEKGQGERWTEHFKEILNQPPPTEEL